MTQILSSFTTLHGVISSWLLSRLQVGFFEKIRLHDFLSELRERERERGRESTKRPSLQPDWA